MWSSRSKERRFFVTLLPRSSQRRLLSTASRGALATDVKIFSQISVGVKLEQITSNRLRTKRPFSLGKKPLPLRQQLVWSSQRAAWKSGLWSATGRAVPKVQRDLCSSVGDRVCGPSRQLALDSLKLWGHPAITTAVATVPACLTLPACFGGGGMLWTAGLDGHRPRTRTAGTEAPRRRGAPGRAATGTEGASTPEEPGSIRGLDFAASGVRLEIEFGAVWLHGL